MVDYLVQKHHFHPQNPNVHVLKFFITSSCSVSHAIEESFENEDSLSLKANGIHSYWAQVVDTDKCPQVEVLFPFCVY